MGKKSGPSAPAAPDPKVVAQAQGAADKDTAYWQAALNNVDTYSPYGSVTYQQLPGSGADGKPPRFSQTTTLNPDAQKAFDAQGRIDAATNQLAEGQIGRISDAVSGPLDFSSLPQITGAGDFTADRDRATQSIIDRNQGAMTRQRESLENQLVNQGIPRGSQAWQAAMDDINRQENDFRLGAYQAGGAEQSRLFGLNQTARQQGISEILQKRGQPINEIAALLGTGQVTMPNAPAPAQTSMQAPDVAGAYQNQYQSQLANWQAQNAARNNAMSGLFGLGGSALGGWAMNGFKF